MSGMGKTEPTGASKRQSENLGRLISGVLLLALGLWLVTRDDTAGKVVGILVLVGAAFQLLVAAIAKGSHAD